MIHLHFGGLCLDIFGWCVSRPWCVYWKREVHCALYKILRLLPHLALRTHSYYLPQLQSSNCFRRLDKNSIMILKVLHSSYSAHLMEKRLASRRVTCLEPVLPRHRLYERSSRSFVPLYYSFVLEVKVISIKFKTVVYCLHFSCSNSKCNSGLI